MANYDTTEKFTATGRKLEDSDPGWAKLFNDQYQNLYGNDNYLKKQVETKANKTDVSSPYNYKGSCLLAALPTSGNTINDTYYVTDKKCKYTWNGSAWYQSSLNESDYEEELSTLEEKLVDVNDALEVFISIDNDKSNLDVIDGYRDDRGNPYLSNNVKSYDIKNKDVFKGIYVYTKGRVSDVRVFDTNMTLIEKFSLSTEKKYVEFKYGYMVSIAFVTYDESDVIIEREVFDPYEKSCAPKNGYENFSVKVNYSDYTTNEKDSVSEYTDYGVIALPTNYVKKGKPTKLIIFCQGTGERTDVTTNPLSNYGWRYLLAKGYAVMDMNGISTEWSTSKGFPVDNQHYCNKYLLSSYAKGYEYVMDKYNLDSRVYVAGISMGGGASALIVQSKILPVVAHVCFCPALSVFKQDYMNPWNGNKTAQQKTIAGQWGFDNWNTTTDFSKDYFIQNYDKVVGFDNLLINTIGNHSEANAHYGDSEETNAYNNMSKIYPVPLKIWHCKDDTTVLERYSEYMVKMIKNAGGQAFLRTFETGGHVGGWSTGVVDDTDINGDYISASIPFYEAIQFLKRFN